MADNVLANATKRTVREQDYTYHTPISDLGAVGVIGEMQLVNAAGTGIGTGAYPLNVQLVDGSGTPLTGLTASAAAGAGGGSIVYSNASGDFSAAANTGTNTVTITGLPFTLEAINVMGGAVKKQTAAGVVTNVDTDTVTVAGGVITFAEEANFSGTDTLYMTFIGPDKWYDKDLDNAKTNTQNPLYGHYTDPADLISAAQDLTGPFTDVGSEIDARTYSKGAFFVNVDINGATGVAFKLLVKHESAGTEEYALDPELWSLRDSTTSGTGGIKTLDSNVDDKYHIPFEVNNATPYMQLQVGCPATAGTAGNLGQLGTVVYTLGSD